MLFMDSNSSLIDIIDIIKKDKKTNKTDSALIWFIKPRKNKVLVKMAKPMPIEKRYLSIKAILFIRLNLKMNKPTPKKEENNSRVYNIGASKIILFKKCTNQ